MRLRLAPPALAAVLLGSRAASAFCGFYAARRRSRRSVWLIPALAAAVACEPAKAPEPPVVTSARPAVTLEAPASTPAPTASASAVATSVPSPPKKQAPNQGLAADPAGAGFGSGTIAWSPRALRLVVARGGDLCAVDLAPHPTARCFEGTDHQMAWSSDGSRFTTGQGELFDTDGFKVLTSPAILQKKGRHAGVTFFPKSSFSADGTAFVVTNGQSRMWFFDARTGQLRKETADLVPGPATASTTSFWSPTGAHLLAVTDGGAARVFDGAGKLGRTLEGRDAAWDPRSESFVVDGSPQGVVLFKASGEQIRVISPFNGDPTSTGLAFSPDGKLLLARKKIFLVDGSLVLDFPDATSITFSPDGRSVLWMANDTVRAMPVDGTGSPVTLRSITTRRVPYLVAWLPDGKRVAYGDDQTLEVLDVRSGASVFPALSATKPLGDQPALSADGAWLAVAGADLQLVRLRDGKVFFVRLAEAEHGASVLVYGTDLAFAGSIDDAERTLRRDGKPLPRDALARLATPDLLTR